MHSLNKRTLVSTGGIFVRHKATYRHLGFQAEFNQQIARNIDPDEQQAKSNYQHVGLLALVFAGRWTQA
jgi:hypothetical protein